MAWQAPPTFVTGELVTAARLNTLSNDLLFLYDPPRAHVTSAANQSIPHNAYQSVAFGNERRDNDGMHSTTTNNSRLTCQTTGDYDVWGTVQFASDPTGYRALRILENGTTEIAKAIQGAVNGDSTSIDTLVFSWPMNAGDYVELQAFQTSGAALNIVFSLGYSPEFAMEFVGN